jgi:DNA-binding transcriptional LysR family regulator
MELRHLRYFRAVAAEGHITRAARRLGIQQAPLSQQLKALEDEIGVRLFHRKPRGVELNEAGRAFLKEVDAIFAGIESAVDSARRATRGEVGVIRIGLTSSACFHPIAPEVVRRYREGFPLVAVRFVQQSTPELIARVRDGSLDAAFIRTVPATPRGLRVERLVDEAMVVALPATHRLARSRRALLLSALQGEPFVGYPRSAGAGLYDAVITACLASGFHPEIAHEAPQITSTLSLVAARLGVSVVPASLACVGIDGVAFRPLSGPQRPRAELNLATSGDSEPSPIVAAFVRQARESAADQRPRPSRTGGRRSGPRSHLALAKI